MAYGVTRTRCGDEDNVEIAALDSPNKVITEAVGEHVVSSAAHLGVDDGDMHASIAKLGGKITVMALAGEDDEGGGPRRGPLERAAVRCCHRWRG